MVEKDMPWNKIEDTQPHKYEYVLVYLDGNVSISRWMGDRFDIKPDGTMPWFRGTHRVKSTEQPHAWKEIPYS